MKKETTSTERKLIRDVVDSMLTSGLLYGEALKAYVHDCAALEGYSIEIRDYNLLESEIYRLLDKKIKILQPDEPLRGAKQMGFRVAKPVYQIDKNTNEILAEFPSVTEAQAKTGAARSVICGVCNGKYKTGGGYKWRYVESTV